MDSYPLASATLIEYPDGARDWKVIRCPYCHQTHLHGAGAPGVDPRKSLGHRASSCIGPVNPGYILVEESLD
jgi:hypothetical protein